MTLQSKDRGKFQAKYRVIISGNVMPECDRQQVVEGLAKLFNSQASTMGNLLKGISTPLKKQYHKEQAEIICKNIREIGAQCTLEEISASETSAEVNDDVVSASGANDETNVATSATESATGDPHRQSSKGKYHTLLMRFVNKNTDYYQPRFSKFAVTDENSADRKIAQSICRITWHWPAFFCFFFWALYRKMWLWAALHVLGGAALMLWVSPGLVSLVWVFIWPVMANYLYFRTASTAVNRAMENPQTAQHYLAKGGVSKVAVCSGIIIVLVSTVLVSNYVTSQFMEEYGEQIQDVLPGSGTQIRGTGLSLEGVVGESKLARTSLTLSALATSLKILLLKNNTDNNAQHELLPMQSVIATFIEHLNAGQISDGWGNNIRIEQHVNRYVLISAGPDRVFKTDDDVIQPIAIY